MASLLPSECWTVFAVIFGVLSVITLIIILCIASEELEKSAIHSFINTYIWIPIIMFIVTCVCIVCKYRAPELVQTLIVHPNDVKAAVNDAVKNYLTNLPPQEKYELLKGNK